MSRESRSYSKHGSRLTHLCAAAVILALLTACNTPPDGGKKQPQVAPAAQKAPPAKESKSPAPAPAKPEHKPEQKPAEKKPAAAKTEEKPVEKAPTAVKTEAKPAEQPSAGQAKQSTPQAANTDTKSPRSPSATLAAQEPPKTAATQKPPQAGDSETGTAGKPETEEDRNALIESIRKQAMAAKAAGATKAPPPAPSKAAPTPAATDYTVTSQPVGKKEGGCGAGQGPQVNLEPPPPDQPQPKFAVKQQKISTDVWAGKPAVFAFEITNEGEAPLAIRLKGG